MQPDAMIVCVNPYDDILLITNTIKYLEGVSGGKVIAIVIFPLANNNDWRSMFGVKTSVPEGVLKETANAITIKFNLPVFISGNEQDMYRLKDLVVEYFCE